MSGLVYQHAKVEACASFPAALLRCAFGSD
jgi:hypothetical protein